MDTDTAPLKSVQVSGVYMATSQNVVTFYVYTAWPVIDPVSQKPMPFGDGWQVTGVTGLAGTVVMRTATNTPGSVKVGYGQTETYNWSFTCQTDTEQNIQGAQHASAVTLYPPDNTAAPKVFSGTISGFYMVNNHRPVFYLTDSAPFNFTSGWEVGALPTVPPGKITVESIAMVPGQVVTLWRAYGIDPIMNAYTSYAILNASVDLPNSDTPIYVNNVPVTQPASAARQISANVQYTSTYSNVSVNINPLIHGGASAPLRSVNEKVAAPPIFQEEYKEVTKTGYNAGTTTSLYAIGPQEVYLQGKDGSDWDSKFPQHSNFVMYQRNIPINAAKFLDQTITVEIKPTEIGDLLSNMHFQCVLPGLSSTSNAYANQVGRALINQVDFLINDSVVETIYDDWFFIRDQLFLDADEQVNMFSAVNNGSNTFVNTTNSFQVIVPLEFFFCRRHSANNSGREKLRRPYFPMCAMLNQKMYIRIKFNSWYWITNDLPIKDISSPALILEEIRLTDSERLYYKTQTLRYVINRVTKAPTQPFAGNNQQVLQLAANFPVQLLVWFFRNKKYESRDSGLYYDSRYEYGYTTKYIQAAVPLTFPTGTVNFIDVIDNAKITLNNVDILSTFQGSLYYSFKQPMEHGLSVPAKNIYMYSFGLNPKEYNAGGYINFSKLNSQTTKLQLTFLASYSAQITQGYNLNLFYYGYTILEFQGGFARLPYL